MNPVTAAAKVSMTYDYDDDFYEIMNHEAVRSAEPILRKLMAWFAVKSVVDFGCGQGAWLSVWKRLAGCDVFGIDGAHATETAEGARLILPDEFRASNLTEPIELGRRFDLVQSLEVGEHLPHEAAPVFVDSLTRHGSIVLFSAAPPGQGGECHINERPYSYWRKLFDERGYQLFDAIRPAVRENADVSYWYQYNTFLYVRGDAMSALPRDVLRTAILPDRPIPDIAPKAMKFWRLLTRPMPPWYVTFIARRIIKPHVVRQYRRSRELASRAAPIPGEVPKNP